MLASERLLEIKDKYGRRLHRIVPLELDEETLRLVLYLKDGTNLRITEQWLGETLKRYSYYWLTSANELKVGWDNAPHHTQVVSFPHHKHIGKQSDVRPSQETSLEQVMPIVLADA